MDVIQLDDDNENENNITNFVSNTKKASNKKSSNFKKRSIKNNNINKNLRSNNNKEKLNKKTEEKESNQEESENDEDKDKSEDARLRKLTDEECLEKMKEKFPDDKGLTKTFITRKLKKRIMIYRKLNFSDEDSYKNVENSIPKKSGPNSFLKITMEICNKEEFSLDSSLMCVMKELFNNYFIVLKEKDKKMKIVIAGHISKDIIFFLKKVSNEEFRNNYSVQTIKIKAYAFYEELINEFYKRDNIALKKINEEDILECVNQYNYLTEIRKAYEEIKLLKVEKN